jgi:aryl-alcohol dehydrogenase-like predicted oxidoreductase
VAWAIAKGTLPIIGVTKENQVLDAVKAVNVTLTEEETAQLEQTADSLNLNVVRMWEKEMR